MVIEATSPAPNSAQRRDQCILLAAVLVANLSQFIQLPFWGRSRTAFAALLLISLLSRSWKTIAAILVFVGMSFEGLILPAYLDGAPVIGFLIPFVLTAALLSIFPQTRSNLRWVRVGNIDRLAWTLVALTSVFSTAALILWAYSTNHLGLGEQFVKGFGSASRLLIYGVYVPAFALLNAMAEEAVYRGLVQESLTRAFRHPALILFLQASAFAAVHYASGFPNGVVGYFMVLIYGSMLGYLRMRTNGILAPFIAHVIADTAIAMLLIHLVK